MFVQAGHLVSWRQTEIKGCRRDVELNVERMRVCAKSGKNPNERGVLEDSHVAYEFFKGNAQEDGGSIIVIIRITIILEWWNFFLEMETGIWMGRQVVEKLAVRNTGIIP